MKLKSLELQGFKSFPDRTVLNFNSGATIVVGPNGSGKSNISDAIRWVLGETSAKGVRGSKMEDVIFAGANSRKQMGTAEVSLILDNTEEIGKIPDRGDEIVVTRRCFRGGESEYMIDRRPARLRDISELFMNTGVGKSGYSIIGQGKIAEIVSQKSEDRRTIFEEAAGISKYRSRKNETERRMENVAENMVRVGDILRELEARVAPLSKESEKAKKYLELFEEKKRLDVALWLYDVENVRKKVSELSDSVAVAKRVLDEADGELSALESKNEHLYDESQATKIKAEQTQRALRENSAAALELEGNIRVINNELEHLKNKKTDAGAELSMHRAAIVDAEKNTEELCAALAGLKETLAVQRGEHEDITAEADGLKEKRLGIESDMAESDRKIHAMNDTLVAGKIRLSEIAGFRDSIGGRKESLSSELSEIAARDALLEERIGKAERTVADYMQRSEQKNGLCTELSEKIKALDARIEALRSAQGKLVTELTSKKQRADTLKRMEEHFEGYNNSVRFVMDNSERGRLDGILGPVSRMIDVPKKYSVAVETALGANIQNIIVENEEAAKRAISLLKQSGAGRATFYPITSVKAQPLNMNISSLERNAGYLGIASELITCDDRCEGVIGYMLGRTAVFDNIDNATDCAKATGYRLRIVTLDGQIINAGGSFTGGSSKRDSGMLTRAQEIARFEIEAEKLNIELTANREKVESLQRESDGLADELEGVKQDLSVLETMVGAEQTQKLVLQSQLENDRAQYDRISGELEQLSAESERGDDERGNLESENERLTAELSAEEGRRDGLEKQHEELNRNISRTLERANEKLIRITQTEKDIESTERDVELSRSTEESLRQRAAGDEENIAGADFQTEQYKVQLETARTELAGLKEDAQRLEQENARLADKGLESDAALSKLRDKIKEESHRRENLFRAYTGLDSKYEQAKSEQDKLSSKLWDEYELTYAAAAALDYPPVTEESRVQSVSRQNELKTKIRALGSVNVGAIDEYKEVSERAEFMRTQYDDLCVSKDDLENIISELETEMKERFIDVMEQLDANFKVTFRELFGGGTAELRLTDREDPLGCGIEINVAPPGKIVKSMSLLSGGEQSFVAIALFFAILSVNPTPFAVLDEIEAALDDVNVARFADYIKRYSGDTQFVVITHRRGTMEIADTLYGVTMPERGISRVLTLNITEVENRLGVKIN